MNKSIFITGATGLVGGKLVAQILTSSPCSRLFLLVRGSSQENARQRVLGTLRTFLPDLDERTFDERVVVLCGDVTKDGLGLDPVQSSTVAQSITHLIHAAANVQFQSSLEEAMATNFEGTRNVMRFARLAREHGRLQRVAYVSTAFTCGNRKGMIREEELDKGQRFANGYEQSKFESERHVRSLMGELPITVFRPSIIVGDSVDGRTTAFNVLYVPLRFVHRGLLRFIPGFRSNPLDVVPVDYVCDAIRHILLETNQGIGQTYHLTAGKDGATTLGEIVDLAVAYFKSVDPRVAIPPLRFVPPQVLRLFAAIVRTGAGRALGLMKVFESYMSRARAFDDSNTRAVLSSTSIRPPRFSSYYRPILQYCLDCSWGKRVTVFPAA